MTRDVNIKAFFAHTTEHTDYNPKLYLPSNWEAPEALIPVALLDRTQNFFTSLKSSFRKRRVSPNLLLFQRQILNDLRDSKELLIVMTNKNLGPAVIERDVYTRRVFEDHLLQADTYRRIEPTEAAEIITTIKMKVGQFLQSFSGVIPANEKAYLLRDIKPDNIVTSRNKTPKCRTYLIDFGLVKRFRDQKTGRHIRCTADKKLTGSARYASVNCH